ncbi:hypothetical protein HGA13_05140 [Nocardia speluncae]|uniref:3-phenylpropionate/cinnamic acid dioxygenase small subunit n=1 Tax=Nocardia speluncae TaxID=419477 RepID=A0A846X8B3_9NOCA|nr:aromatic-ring-hydroxylating dioxygenase subunit beta [Nocardia speluncae]NKY32461.1 hypothetical protein [Nocardia speluncae]
MSAPDLIHHENLLLDERRYEEWLLLFAPESRYWAPYRWDAPEPLNEVNLVYDDLPRLAERVSRLTGGDLHAQDPASQTVRMLGQPAKPVADGWAPAAPFDEVVTAPFRLTEYRSERFTEYTGRYTYWLTGAAGTWRIAAKKVQLLGSEGPLGNLTFLL